MKKHISYFFTKVKTIKKDFLIFILATAFYAFSLSLVESSFNNFLSETFNITNFQRGFLELPRELPGLLVIGISALLFFLSSRSAAGIANIIAGVGILSIGFLSTTYSSMLVFLFIYSAGQHLFLPLNQSIGMQLSQDGKEGKRLGQLSGIGNIFAILGSFVVFLGFKFLNFNFKTVFFISFVAFTITGILILLMSQDKKVSNKERFTFKKEYGIYYWLCILFGTRKQIFLTFAPWVLITVFSLKTQDIATLLVIGGIIGIVFKPLLGYAIDKLGEKTIFIFEAVVLFFVCILYAFSKKLFIIQVAVVVTSISFVTDQLLMSVNMARSTFLKKIVRNKDDIPHTLTLGVSIDHIFSVSIALISGVVWKFFGYEAVFMIGAFIALVNFFTAINLKKS